MPAVVRVGDNSTGHGCYPPMAATTGSPNVFVNSRPVVRVGDYWNSHACPGSLPHDGVASSGSSSVFANGRPIVRVGDSISCGDTAGEGSPDVFAK